MSAEARCPVTKKVQNPMDTRFPIEDVFFNICGITNANATDQAAVNKTHHFYNVLEIG